MDSMKKALEIIDGQIRLAEFLKEMRDKLPKLGDLPTQISNLELTKSGLSAKVDELTKKLAGLTAEVQTEKAKQIEEIQVKLTAVSDIKAALEGERAKLKNDSARLLARETELTQMIAGYERETKAMLDTKAQLNEKLKKIGEVAVA